MHDELLMPCPLCGGRVHNDTITLTCVGRRHKDDDELVDCPYCLDVGDGSMEKQSTRTVRLARAHNDLARRAEIGRLVEALHNVLFAQARWYAQGDTLLDALRAVAKQEGVPT